MAENILPKPSIYIHKNIDRWAVARSYFENRTLEETGRIFNITRERVRKIINELGYKPRRSTPRIRHFVPTNAMSSRQRFWSYVDIRSENECWEWQGKRVQPLPYGFFYCFRKNRYAHQLAFIFSRHAYPKNWVLHHCDNPPCCNPKHLYDGTPKDNARDREIRGRANRGKKFGASTKKGFDNHA